MVGETIWKFEQIHRVYRRNSEGRCFGEPIWREHWVPRKVKSETSRSWVLSDGTKVPKTGSDPRLFAFAEFEIDEQAYVEENRHLIAERVHRLRSPQTLRAIANLLDSGDKMNGGIRK